MTLERTVAYLLIGLGVVALLARATPDSGWLWVALAAAGFLVAYSRERSYGLLVVGGVLAGVAGGLLLEGGWGWDGGFLIGLGAGFLLIDRVEPRPSRWPVYPAAILIGLGILFWLVSSGVTGSLWFPLLLLAVGFYLLRRDRDGDWVTPDSPSAPATEAPAPPPAPVEPNPPQAAGSPAEASPKPAGPPEEAAVPPASPAEPDLQAPLLKGPAVAERDAAQREVAEGRVAERDAAVGSVAGGVDEAAVAARHRALEEWRAQRAELDGRSAGRILSDDTLQRLAEDPPEDLDELLAVKGVGPVTAERYGEQLLAVLRR